MTHKFEQSRANEFETISGSYTDAMMKDDLKYDEHLGYTL